MVVPKTKAYKKLLDLEYRFGLGVEVSCRYVILKNPPAAPDQQSNRQKELVEIYRCPSTRLRPGNILDIVCAWYLPHNIRAEITARPGRS